MSSLCSLNGPITREVSVVTTVKLLFLIWLEDYTCTVPRTPFYFRYNGLDKIYEAATKFKCDDPYYPASVYASQQFEMNTVCYSPTDSEPSEPVIIFTYQLKDNLYVSCVIRANIATRYDQYDLLNLRPSVFNCIIRDLKIKVHGVITTDPTGPETYCIKAPWSYPRTGVASAPTLPSPWVSTWKELKKRQTTSHGDPKEQKKKRILDKIASKQGEHDNISESVVSSTSTAAVTSDVAQLNIHKHKNKKELKKKRENRLYYSVRPGQIPVLLYGTRVHAMVAIKYTNKQLSQHLKAMLAGDVAFLQVLMDLGASMCITNKRTDFTTPLPDKPMVIRGLTHELAMKGKGPVDRTLLTNDGHF
jgi:hypothetical protein